MNSWSRMRKRIILALVIVVTLVLVGIPMYYLLYRAPTCSDLTMNGDETGIDCGGSCQKLCTVESLPLIVKGDPQVLEVTPGTYEVVAVLENSNAQAEIRHAHYTFNLYSSGSLIPLKTIEGDTYVPKGATFTVFEGPFEFTDVTPSRATIEWDLNSLVWEKNTKAAPNITVENIDLSRTDTNPRIEATLKNGALAEVQNIELTALLYDETGSVFAASKTFIDSLPAEGEVPIIFTWPKPFPQPPVEVKVLTRILPDQSYLR